MTDNQLEKASRIYCDLLGQDPDNVLTRKDGEQIPLWQVVLSEVKHAFLLNEAIRMAKETEE